MVSINYTSIKYNFWKKHRRKSLRPCVRQRFLRIEKAGSTTEKNDLDFIKILKFALNASSLPPGALAPVPKKLLMMAEIDHCYTSARGKPTFDAISKTYSYLTPDLWKEKVFTKPPYQDHLVKTHTRVSMQRTQAPAVATT